MNKAQLSLFVFGLYMVFVVGLGFMLMPLFILNLFGLAAGDDVWIRVVGMLASIIGGYYILAVHAKLLFAAIDAGAATWTWFAVRSIK